jgi:hypothetical protein
MEVKKNLNNVQRKMLDEIYTEQFKKRERTISDERQAGLNQLQQKCLKGFKQDKEVKKMLEVGKAFYELQEKLSPKMDASGISLNRRIGKVPQLEICNRYYGYDRKEFPEVTVYQSETTRIELRLAEKKKEMRAKIYGVSASYEDVDAEIKELLKDI